MHEVYMRLLKTDLWDILETCVEGRLAETKVEWNPGFAANVMLASGGYPDHYRKGFPIMGIDDTEKVPGVIVFHAGTELKNGRLMTSGGRVLSVSAIGVTLKEALDRAYEAVTKIHFDGMYYRRDIGYNLLHDT